MELFFEVGTDIGRPVYNISNDFCILPIIPEQFFIDCYHDTIFPIRPDPAPEAIWTLNGISQPDTVNTFLQDEPLRIGTNDRLQIFNDDFTEDIKIINDILGTYVCVLSNAFGSDTATTVVTKCVCIIMCNVYVCIYACMYVCMYVCIYVYQYR